MRTLITLILTVLSYTLSAQVIDTNYIGTNGVQTDWIFPANTTYTYDSTVWSMPQMNSPIPYITSQYVSGSQLYITIIDSAYGCMCPIRKLRGYIALYSYYH